MKDKERHPTTKELMKTAEFYEEMLLLSAQEVIAELMQNRDVNKAELAKKLKKTKAHVTSLLADGRNLTLKSLARVCYHLGAEVKISVQPINHQSLEKTNNYEFSEGVVEVPTTPTFSNFEPAYLH